MADWTVCILRPRGEKFFGLDFDGCHNRLVRSGPDPSVPWLLGSHGEDPAFAGDEHPATSNTPGFHDDLIGCCDWAVAVANFPQFSGASVDVLPQRYQSSLMQMMLCPPTSLISRPAGRIGLLTLLACVGSASPTRPNVLFIMSDDLRPDLSCYGSSVETPNLDRLAGRGVRFERSWVQYPLCNPSRTSMLTGRYPTTTGALTNRIHFRHSYPDMVTLPQLFKNAGYDAVGIGKVFHDSADDLSSWTNRLKRAPDPTLPDSGGKPYSSIHRLHSDRIIVLEGDGETYPDYTTADQTIAALREHAQTGRPFFITCGFQKPHSPPAAPKKWFDALPLSSITLPVDFKPEAEATPGFPAAALPQNGDLFIGRKASEAQAREMIQAYQASVKWVDWNAGRVLDTLRELGLEKNTIVVFWGDHGYHLGEKGKWSKHGSLFDLGLRVPFIMAGPGIAAAGVSPRVVQALDIFPTLAELCSLTPPAGIEGRSLVPLLQSPAAAWPHPAYAVTYRGGKLHRAVRDERFLYAEFDNGREGAMLIDLLNDPRELNNRIDQPKYGEELSRMRKLLSFLPAEAKVLPEY
jgi:iduronate 2-sulfatase